MFKKLGSIASASVLIVTTLLFTPGLTNPASASSGSSDIGGGGTGSSDETNNNTNPGAYNPLCHIPKVSGSYAGNVTYYLPPFTKCKDAYKEVAKKNPRKKYPVYTDEFFPGPDESRWLPGVAQCTIGFDEFRFYGTTQNPIMAGTLSRINVLDRCLPSNVASARVFYPNPKDAQFVQTGSIWNRVGDAENYHLDKLHASDNCSNTLKFPDCLATSLPPRASFGTCTSLQVKGANSIEQYLRNPATPAEFKAKIQGALLSQYNLVRDNARKAGSLYPNARAASSIDFNYPITTPGVAPLIRDAAGITSIGDAYNCSSAVEFIPVIKEENRPAAVIGACVVPLVLDSKVYSLPDSGVFANDFDPEDVVKQLEGKLSKNKFSFNYPGPWATMNDLRYSNQKAKISNPSSGLYISEIAKNISPPITAYRNGIRRLVLADPAPSGAPMNGAVTKATDYAKFDLRRTFDHYANPNDPVYKQSSKLRSDRQAAADRAASSATCWSMELATSFGNDLPPIPVTPAPTPTPTPPSMLPPSTPTAPVTPVPPQPSSTGIPGDNNLQVSVTIRPKEFYAGGKDFDNYINLNDVTVTRTPRLTTDCNSIHSGWCMTDISPLQGRIVLTPSSNFPARFPSCSGSNCLSYENHSNIGSVNLQTGGNPRVTGIWNFYTPTQQGQWMNLSLQNPRLTYVLREKVWRNVKVGERENCVPRRDPRRPPRCTREDIIEPRPFIEYRRTVTVTNVEFRTSDGSSLSRPVIGTIGG